MILKFPNLYSALAQGYRNKYNLINWEIKNNFYVFWKKVLVLITATIVLHQAEVQNRKKCLVNWLRKIFQICKNQRPLFIPKKVTSAACSINKIITVFIAFLLCSKLVIMKVFYLLKLILNRKSKTKKSPYYDVYGVGTLNDTLVHDIGV